jgi:hypothetical protein
MGGGAAERGSQAAAAADCHHRHPAFPPGSSPPASPARGGEAATATAAAATAAMSATAAAAGHRSHVLRFYRSCWPLAVQSGEQMDARLDAELLFATCKALPVNTRLRVNTQTLTNGNSGTDAVDSCWWQPCSKRLHGDTGLVRRSIFYSRVI